MNYNPVVLPYRRLHPEQASPGIDNMVPIGYDYPEKPADPKDVCRESLLGGLLNHYYVKRPLDDSPHKKNKAAHH